MSSHKKLHTNVYISSIQNCQQLETTKCLLGKDKWSAHKMGCNSVIKAAKCSTPCSWDASQRKCAERSRSQGYRWCDSHSDDILEEAKLQLWENSRAGLRAGGACDIKGQCKRAFRGDGTVLYSDRDVMVIVIQLYTCIKIIELNAPKKVNFTIC